MFSYFLFATSIAAFMISNRAFASSVSRTIDKRACFGAGCYWGTEKFFKKDFGVKVFADRPPITSGQVGFMGPPTAKPFPTYKEVCTGTTEQVEVYDLVYDGDEKTYEALVKHFFMFHDPTFFNRQGNDVGTQYASTIFYYDDRQKEIAERVKNELQALINAGQVTSYHGNQVATILREATTFFPAHEDHQEYLEKNPGGYCNHFYRLKAWPAV